jgi:hypothetical protein
VIPKTVLSAAVLLALSMGAATPAAGQSPSVHTIRTSDGSVARIGPFRPSRDPTVGAAVRAFGRPTSRTLTSPESCRVEWRRLRLRIVFVNLGGNAPGQTTCGASSGRAQSFTVRGSRFRTWAGLRVGRPSAEIRTRHPSATFRDGAWWLRTAVSPFGDESEYAVVSAIVAGGRVRALAGWVGAAGE